MPIVSQNHISLKDDFITPIIVLIIHIIMQANSYFICNTFIKNWKLLLIDKSMS